jgi:hypothetical protein
VRIIKAVNNRGFVECLIETKEVLSKSGAC